VSAITRRHARAGDPAAGFTLVEILIALMLLAVGILGVARMFPAGSRAQVQDHLLTAANDYARETLEDLSALAWSDTALSAGRHPGGTAEEAIGSAGQWQRHWDVTVMAAPLDNLKKVDVTVRYQGAGLSSPRSVVASTYLRK
jgi:prepilin-type N-terminal cleavage/methylation domain-containing protein